MDPLSAAASIIGILGAAAKVSSVLTALIGSTREASHLARSVLIEISDISACLSQLQVFLLGNKAVSRSRASLLMVEQIVVTLTNCVIAFSELEKVVDRWGIDRELVSVGNSSAIPLKIRMKLVKEEQDISRLCIRLQSSKASLSLMLTTLTCTSNEEAQTSVDDLTELVHQVLQNNQDISQRLSQLEVRPSIANLTRRSSRAELDDDGSTIIPGRRANEHDVPINLTPTGAFEFAFDQDLRDSRVYKRALLANPESSSASSAINSIGWSFLSGLSLTDVTCISVISLPISATELWNSSYYNPENVKFDAVSGFSDEEETAFRHLSTWEPHAIGCVDYQHYALPSVSIYCEGCGQPIDEKRFAFDDKSWHIDCFRCEACSNFLEYTSATCTSDGQLRCFECRPFRCSSCDIEGMNTDDLIIYASHEAWYADYFCCQDCEKRGVFNSIDLIKPTSPSPPLCCLVYRKWFKTRQQKSRERTLARFDPGPLNNDLKWRISSTGGRSGSTTTYEFLPLPDNEIGLKVWDGFEATVD